MKAFTLLLVLLSGTSAGFAQQPDPGPGPSGFVVTGPGQLIAWSALAQRFALLRLELGSTPRWTGLPLPQELTRFLKIANGSTPVENTSAEDLDQPQIQVTYANGLLHLFWADADHCAGPKAAPPRQCTLLYSAETTLEPVNWKVTPSRLRNDEDIDSIDQVVLTPDGGGWMTVTGQPGAGQLPSLLAVSSDGGHHWRASPANGMPIGRNHPELTIVRSAKEAWAIAVDLDDEDPPLVVTRSLDGGANWTRYKGMPQTLPWCQHCHPTELSRQDNSVHSGRTCFEVVMAPDKDGHTAEARYCLRADGRGWGAPIPLALPPEMNQPADGEQGGELPMFANGSIGFNVDWIDTASNGTSARRMLIYQTGDGGKTWVPSKLMQMLHPQGEEVFSLQQVAQSGDAIVVLLTSADRRVLLQSLDQGQTWAKLAGR